MSGGPVPYQRLDFFRKKIGFDHGDVENLAEFGHLFIRHKDRFASHFYDLFLTIPETRLILEQQERPEFLKSAWANWFQFIFKADPGMDLLAYLWRIGARHVEVNLDQRFSNLGFSLVRQFCHEIVLAEIPHEKIGTVSSALNKLLDLCVLIETDAYIENTTRCDIEVMREVADRVRNPVTVIGGNIRRLQKRVEAGSKEYGLYDRLMLESLRLERMVRDINVYMEVFQKEPELGSVPVEPLVRDLLRRLRAEHGSSEVKVDIDLDPEAGRVKGERGEMEHLFYYLLQNSIEAVDAGTGYIRISSRLDRPSGRNVEIEIFNTGAPPRPEEIENLFRPFYSTKPAGSGFGLPIARLVARKHFGRLSMEPVENEGTRVTVTLPRGE